MEGNVAIHPFRVGGKVCEFGWHNLKFLHFSEISNWLNNNEVTIWTCACLTAGVSVGKCYVVIGARHGRPTAVRMRLGPFQG
jgi:hypothetical protein